MSKRTKIIIIVILVAVVIVGLLAYFFLFVGKNRLIDNEAFFGAEGEVVDVTPPANIDNGTLPPLSEGLSEPQSRYRNITQQPSVGLLATTTSYGIALIHVERETGHMFETVLSSTESTRISNTTIPRLHDVIWNNDLTHGLYRYLDADTNESIVTLVGTVPNTFADDQNTTLLVNFLPQNILSIAFSPSGQAVAYVEKTASGSRIVTSDLDGSNADLVYSSPLREWNIFWESTNTLILSTKGSFDTPGYVYSLSLSTGSLRRLYKGTAGISVLPNQDGSKLLVSSLRDGVPELSVVDSSTGQSFGLTLKTLAEKCVWERGGVHVYCGVPEKATAANLPDTWYRGSVSFNDSLWRANTETGTISFVVSPSDYDAPSIDAVDLTLNESNTVLLFRNKKDSSIWSYRL